ncbi:peptide ABC transporter substrate-binding protein [Kribbella sp. GL6]|uniref:peptide ABC transporter substrate-binding protein n=1 Tax=Kribbella sp. GL6 TaxID=3419765 RepID=UPI003D0230B4
MTGIPASSAARVRRRVVAVLVAVSMTVLAACAGKSSASDGDQTFAVGIPAFFVQNLTPGSSGSSYVDYAIWSPLTRVDGQSGKLEMLVADSIESTDNVNWTIKLKSGWTFQDGSPVTAQSFADSWNTTALGANAQTNNASTSIFAGYAAMNPPKGKPAAKTLSGVHVVDKSTLKVTLLKPNALLPYILSSTTFAPLPASAAKDLKNFGTHPIGNGPYKTGGWDTGAQEIKLERYDGYGGTKALASGIDLHVYQQTGAIYTDFQAGTIDLALLDGADLSKAKKDTPSQVVDVQYPAVVYLSFPLYDSRFANPQLRKAISMAIDRDAIVKSLLAGNAKAATGLAPPTLTGGGEAKCDACKYDPQGAKAALQAAGGWNGPMMLYTYQDPTNEKVLQAIANQLRTNLGLQKVSFESQPIAQLYQGLGGKSIKGPSLLYSGAPYPHIYALADQMFSAGAPLNVTGYDSKSFAGLIAQAASSKDADSTTNYAKQAAEQALADLPVAPLYWPVGGLVHSDRLSGVVPEVLGGARLSVVKVG